MKYNMAAQTTSSTPCTNVPIHCPLCTDTVTGTPRTIWKYNTVFHLASEHSEGGNMPADLPTRLLVDMFISKREEGLMGIERELTEKWRDEHGFLNSDVYEERRQILEQEQPQASKRRPRAPSSPPSSSAVQHPSIRARR